eukprot:TRINITY_DN50602_c0_g1_i1.p1 TRINITY_DN50602_c0_g1~~TRINITY_DN50602_c0_g1_i1.p1  ORF type:complete len:545 (-),score=126.96 TRINITY_DN50602_c0_g1_i1:106-1740(-)
MYGAIASSGGGTHRETSRLESHVSRPRSSGSPLQRHHTVQEIHAGRRINPMSLAPIHPQPPHPEGPGSPSSGRQHRSATPSGLSRTPTGPYLGLPRETMRPQESNSVRKQRILRSEHFIHKKRKNVTILQLVFAFIGILIFIGIQERKRMDDFSEREELILKSCLSFSTLLLLIFIVWYHKIRLRIEKMRTLVPPNASLYESGRLPVLIFELLINLVHTPPLVPFPSERVESAIGFLIIVRVYLIVRVMYHTSVFYSSAGRFVGSFSKMDFSSMFVLRSYIETFPFVVLFSGMILLVLIVSYGVHITERSETSLHKDYLDSVWMTCVTLTTIGYGDYVPTTTIGRSIVIVGAGFGVVLTALIITVVHKKMQLSMKESRVVMFLRKNQLRREFHTLACICIQRAYRYHRKKKRCCSCPPTFVSCHGLLQAVKRFRHVRFEIGQSLGSEDERSILETLYAETLDVRDNVKNIMVHEGMVMASGKDPHEEAAKARHADLAHAVEKLLISVRGMASEISSLRGNVNVLEKEIRRLRHESGGGHHDEKK